MSLWILLAVLGGIASSAFSFSSRYLLKDKDDSLQWGWFFEIARFAMFGVIAFWDFSLVSEVKTFVLLSLIGLTEFFAIYFYMKMHAFSHLSISTIVSRTRMIWIPFFAFIFLHEVLTPSQYIGIAILFVGLSIVVAPHKMFVDKGTMYANLSAVSIAIFSVLVKATLPYASSSVIYTASCIPAIVLLPFLLKNPAKELIQFSKQKFWLKVGSVAVSVLGLYFFIAALRLGEVSRVNAVYQGMFVLAVIGGIIFLKERDDIAKKLIGAFVSLVGILLLT